MPTFTAQARTELLAMLKAQEPPVTNNGNDMPNDMLPFLGNLCCMRLVLAWPSITIENTDGDVEYRGGNYRDCRKIWLGVELDYNEIAETARIPLALVRQYVAEAQIHLWVYPDGTVNAWAERLARMTMAKLAGGNKRKRKDDE